jgi:hypothetical protein
MSPTMAAAQRNVAFIPLTILTLIFLGGAGLMSIEPLVALAGTDTAATVVRAGSRSGKYARVSYLVVKAGARTGDVRVGDAVAARVAPGTPVTVRVGPAGTMAATWADHDPPTVGLVVCLAGGVLCLVAAISAGRRRKPSG